MMLLNIIGLGLIILIVWWFWLSSNKRVIVADKRIQITVENGIYTPDNIQVEQGQPLVLQFIRNDPSPCAEQVIFDKLNLSVTLPVGESVDVTIPTEEAGRFEFTCQMQMYRGILEINEVKDNIK